MPGIPCQKRTLNLPSLLDWRSEWRDQPENRICLVTEWPHFEADLPGTWIHVAQTFWVTKWHINSEMLKASRLPGEQQSSARQGSAMWWTILWHGWLTSKSDIRFGNYTYARGNKGSRSSSERVVIARGSSNKNSTSQRCNSLPSYPVTTRLPNASAFLMAELLKLLV